LRAGYQGDFIFQSHTTISTTDKQSLTKGESTCQISAAGWARYRLALSSLIAADMT